MSRRVLAFAAAVAMVLMTAAPVGAITNGSPDGNAHPYVGLLVFDDATGPAWRCSGTLISPTVVLTAGHCTEGAVAARVWFQADVTSGAAPSYPYGGAGSGATEGTPHTNPLYGTKSGYGGGNGLPAYAFRDIGVVVLDRPVEMSQYGQLPSAGLVGDLKSKAKVDFVGYGVQYQAKIAGSKVPQPPPYYRWTGPRVRMYAPSELVSGKFVHNAEFLRLALNPGGGSGGTCFGDSGGPDLQHGTTTVLGVNSYVTNVNCSGVGYSSRVDVPQVLNFIRGYMD